MKKIKCPTCGHEFIVDETDFYKRFSNVRDLKFTEDIKRLLDKFLTQWEIEIDISTNPDPLFVEVACFAVMHHQISLSEIQRNFPIGFNSAGHLINQLEAAYIISPMINGMNIHDVYIKDEKGLEEALSRCSNWEPSPLLGAVNTCPKCKHRFHLEDIRSYSLHRT